MLINLNADSTDHSACVLTYDEAERWLCATWQGYVDPLEAQAGAEAYLRCFGQAATPLLLNDNSRLRGPWFDSLDWLGDVWVPQAERLGLRYVAHVIQTDRPTDILSMSFPRRLPFELQIFQDLEAARQWLRQYRGASLPQAA